MVQVMQTDSSHNTNSMLILLAGMLLVLIPQYSHLPAWLSVVCTALVFWRIAYETGHVPLPGRFILFLLTLMLLAGIILSYHTLLGKQAGSALLLGLISLKLFEIKTFRDIALLIQLSLFAIVINFLFNQSIPVALSMIIAVLFLFTALLGFNYLADKTPARPRPAALLTQEKPRFWQTGKMLLQATPLAVILFILFPRVDSPLWGLPEDAFSASSGLSDTMSPGKISRLSDNNEVAFRVLFNTPVPPVSALYWRGPVFTHFDGFSWKGDKKISNDNFIDLIPLGNAVDYTVTLQPHNNIWLFALDMPVSIPRGSKVSRNLQLVSLTPVRKLLRYRLTSYTQYQLSDYLSPNLQDYLQLPDSNKINLDKAKALIDSLAVVGKPRQTIANLLDYFATNQFYYTRTPPLLLENPVQQFLFESKQGYCEHYASTFAVLMRLAGLPSRVVTGYQGGEINPINQYMIVRQSDAHAWVEVFAGDEGWVRVDPTSVIPASNIENPEDALRLTAVRTGRVRPASHWLYRQFKRVRFAWDAINNRWNQWILGYSSQSQKALFNALGVKNISWQGLSHLLFTFLAIVTAILAYRIFSVPTTKSDPASRVYQRFLKKIARKGLQKKPAESATTFAQRAIKKFPNRARSIREITHLYISLRYNRFNSDQFERLQQQLKHFRL